MFSSEVCGWSNEVLTGREGSAAPMDCAGLCSGNLITDQRGGNLFARLMDWEKPVDGESFADGQRLYVLHVSCVDGSDSSFEVQGPAPRLG